MSCSPSWDLLMKYEFEVRKYAVRKVNESGATLAEGMALARTSMEHRTSYFITPLAMPGSRVSAVRPAALPAPDGRGNKRSAEEAALVPYEGGGSSSRAAVGSGGGKSKGKGKDKKQRTLTLEELKKLSPIGAYKAIRNNPGQYRIKFRGPDGVPRCHNYQSDTCKIAGCKFTHVCVRCGGAHGAAACPDLGLGR